jgi:hypothetical protein
MFNDFLPPIISVGILAAAFLFVWSTDFRKSRRVGVVEPGVDHMIDTEGGEELSMLAE